MSDNNKELENQFKGEQGRLLILPEFRKYDLNMRQAKFCQMKAYGYSNTEAARAAGYAKTYAYQYGFNLMLNPKVNEYIQYLQTSVAYSYGVSKNRLIEELETIKIMALQDKKLQTAISAIKAIANICGMDNGKNPEKESSPQAENASEVNNYLINFTKSIPEDKRKIMDENNISPSVDFQIMEDFNNEINNEQIANDLLDKAKDDIIEE